MTPALPDRDQERLAELRRAWLQHPDRRTAIEDQAAQIRALSVIREAFPDAEIIDNQTGPNTERTQ